MPLTDVAIRNAKAQDKPVKMTDERGLYLLINQAGKYWRFDYRFDNKRKTLALGVYPDVNLKEVRSKRDGIDNFTDIQKKGKLSTHSIGKKVCQFAALIARKLK